MKLETLSECLASWMEYRGLTVAELTELLGFKSKTSVFRLLQGKSNAQSMRKLLESLSPYLEEEWHDRFQQALRVEQYGLERYRLLQAITDSTFDEPPEDAFEYEGPREDTILIFGHPWKHFFPILDALLRNHNKVIHYISREDIFLHPELLTGLISHITAMEYQAILLHGPADISWNVACTESGQVFLRNRWLSTGDQDLNAVMRQDGTPLYHYSQLHRGNEYIRFMEDAFELENGAGTVILRPTPGLQMIPPEIVYQAFTDYLSENIDTIALSSSTLRIMLEKRVHNFYHRKKPTTILLSREAMEKFAKDGMLSDHFYAMRPFSRKERAVILKTLENFSGHQDVRMALMADKTMKYSFEAYENRGVLVYPSTTNYNSELEEYRELFLPGNEFFELLSDSADVLFDRNVGDGSTVPH